MAEEKQPNPKPRKRRGWFRRCLRACLWLLLLLAVFHRPLVHYGGRWAVIWLAKREGIALDLRIEGNLWSRFEMHDLRATGDSRAPIGKLTLDRVVLEYSIPKLVRGDVTGVRALEIGNVDAIITPQPSEKKPGPAKPARPLAETLRTVLSSPFPSPKLTIGRVDLLVRGKAAATEVRGLSVRDGLLAWERIVLPGVPPMEAASAKLALTADRIALDGLRLWPEITVSSLEVKRGTAGGVSVLMELAGGRAAFSAKPDAKTNALHGSAELTAVAAEKLAERFGAKLGVAVKVKSVAGEFAVVPEDAAGLLGDLRFTIDAATPNPGPGALLTGTVKLAAGVVKLEDLSFVAAGLELEAGGTLDIGGLLNKTAALPEAGEFSIKIASRDLSLAGKEFNLPLAGKLEGGGILSLSGGAANCEVSMNAVGVRAGSAEIEMADLKVAARKILAEIEPMNGLSGEITLNSGIVNAGAVHLDRVEFSAALRDLRATVSELRVESGKNKITATADAMLSAKGLLAAAPGAEFVIEAPELEHFGIEVNKAKLRGTLSGEGTLTAGDPAKPGDLHALRGSVKLGGTALALGEAPIGGFDIAMDVADGVAVVKQIALGLGEGNTVNLEGRGSLSKPNAYSGKLAVNLAKLDGLQPLLKALGVKQKIAGGVKLDWAGDGDLANHNGTAALAANAIRADDLSIAKVRLGATYSPLLVQTTELLVVADRLRASGKILWTEGRLDIPGIEMMLGDQRALTVAMSSPVDFTGKKPVPSDQTIYANLVADKLDLGKLFAALGIKPPVTGTISADLTANGTLATPVIALKVGGRGLRPAPPVAGEPLRFGATDFDLNASLQRDYVNLKGDIRQPELKPIALTASFPFSVLPLLDGSKPDLAKIPLKATLEMPVSDIGFATRLSPALKTLEGNAAILVRAGGTLAEPRMDGLVALKLKTLRLANPSIPPVNDFIAQVGFAGDTVTFERFSGESGGGTFALTGKINVAKPSEPLFSLGFTMKQMLLMRNDAIVVRADSDLTLNGPLSSATAAGAVFITQSAFAKDIDILPLSLPGKAKPLPRTASQPTTISFPDPPLRDWKFDIAVKTRADDPFRVRGNLASGEVSLDVRFAGTGLEPYLTGAATIDRFRATLPVSTLKTRRGLVTFSQAEPFVPQLDIEAESVIRRHTVVARVGGDSARPRLDLESEPPLEQGEILSLLTTGSLTGEVGANNAAMATRAAILVVKGWYKKLFKKDFPASSDDGGDSLMERFEVELGNMDQRTGQQEVTAQFRVTDDLFFLGDLEMGGGFTGRVKYFIRFK